MLLPRSGGEDDVLGADPTISSVGARAAAAAAAFDDDDDPTVRFDVPAVRLADVRVAFNNQQRRIRCIRRSDKYET